MEVEVREPVSATLLLLFRGDTIDVLLLYAPTSSPGAVGAAEADVVLWNGPGASGHVLARCRLLHPNIRMVEATASRPVTFSASLSFEPALKRQMICYEHSMMHGRAGHCTQLTPLVMNMPPWKEPIHIAEIATWSASLNSDNKKTSAISRPRRSLAVNFQSFEPALEWQMIFYEHSMIGLYTQTPLVMNLPGNKEPIHMATVAICSGSRWFYNDFVFRGIPQREGCSWRPVLGYPMRQTVPCTCALVAATVCLEAQHRLEFEKLHGAGTFPCRAASPRILRRSCERDGIWIRDVGVLKMAPLLDQIMTLGGVRTTKAPAPLPSQAPLPSLLPLSSWKEHKPGTRDDFAKIVDAYGPCIGVTEMGLRFATVYPLDDDQVELAHQSGSDDKRMVDRHAMVCYSYSYRGTTGLEVLVLDNLTARGPKRWIQFDELLLIYTLKVDAMDATVFAGRCIKYPRSRT